MDWSRLKHLLPVEIRIRIERRRIEQLHKVNVFDLEVCKPKGILRERSFWRTEKMDFYHLFPDGTIKHTPGDT